MVMRPNLKALSSFTPISFEGAVYRVVFEGFKDKVLSTEGNRFYPGRYHLLGEMGILYASLTEEIAIKEIERHAPRNILQERLIVAKINVRLHKILDLTQTST